MIQLNRTNGADPDFTALVELLDADLAVRDGDEHAFYAQFNKISNIQYAVVAYAQEQPVACGAFRVLEPGIAEIKRMYTLPEMRGQGIASVILSALEAWALELSFEKCVLETGLKQPEAIALYQKNGYVRIPNYGQYVGVENSVCFEKQL